jgi:serine/threonine protein kinase
MALTPHIRLGPFEVTALLGAGGMGEVYRARDTQLERDVALKTVPDTFLSDPDRVARFLRDAKVLASLNHPNKCLPGDRPLSTEAPGRSISVGPRSGVGVA